MNNRDVFAGYTEAEQSRALDWLAREVAAFPEAAAVEAAAEAAAEAHEAEEPERFDGME